MVAYSPHGRAPSVTSTIALPASAHSHPTDNAGRIGGVEVTARWEHNMTGSARLRTCNGCGKEYVANHGNSRFCTTQCQGRSWRERNPGYGAVSLDEAAELVALYQQLGTLGAVAQLKRVRVGRVGDAVRAAGITVTRIRTRPLRDRLMEKVRVDANGCWLWTASIRANGYGQFVHQGSPRQAHRVSYECLVGPIPEGLHIDHLCFVRHCVNPAHLEPVTQAENNRRAAAKKARDLRGDAQ